MRDLKTGRWLPTDVPKHCKNGHEFTQENTYLHPNGYRICRECTRISREKWALDNKEEHMQQARDYVARNPERRVQQARKSMWKRSGFTPESFREKLVEQNNVCDICGVYFADIEDTRVDHEHVEPPKPRGILCNNCNSGIGFLQDSPIVLEAAAEYLRRYSVYD